MTGETTDVGVLTGLRRRLEAQGFTGNRRHHLSVKEHLITLGNILAALGQLGIGCHAGGCQPDFIACTGLYNHQIMRRGIGINEFQLHRLACLHLKTGDIIKHPFLNRGDTHHLQVFLGIKLGILS